MEKHYRSWMRPYQHPQHFSKVHSLWGADEVHTHSTHIHIRSKMALFVKTIEGDQNMPPQSIPFWQKNYFVLKATEKQQMQEEFSAFSPSA